MMCIFIINKNQPRKADVISEMVRGDVQCLHEIEAEICRWEDILYTDYARYLRRELDIYPIRELH